MSDHKLELFAKQFGYAIMHKLDEMTVPGNVLGMSMMASCGFNRNQPSELIIRVLIDQNVEKDDTPKKETVEDLQSPQVTSVVSDILKSITKK